MDLSIQNPWWRNPQEIENDSKVKAAIEKIQPTIEDIETKENLILLGPRQVGKTTAIKLSIRRLLSHTAPRNIMYFSCEPLNKKNDIIDLVVEFDRISPSGGGKKYIFLDEVTQIKDWELAVKYIIETELGKNKVLVCTGSNAMLLKKGSERLPGRTIKTELFMPKSFSEFIRIFGSKDLKKALSDRSHKKFEINEVVKAAKILIPFLRELNEKLHIYLKTGGYLKPAYEHMETGRIREDTYEIFVKWILGDISRFDKKEAIFKSMVRGIIKNYTSKFSLLSFSKEMEIPSHATVLDYLDLLSGLLLVNNLYQVDLTKKLPVFRKERKSYFLDPFFYSVFQGHVLGKYQDYSEENESKLMEGVVCEALARLKRKSPDTSSFLWFFSNKKETDFVLREGSLYGIEVKWREKATRGDFSNFYSFKKRILLTKNAFQEGDVLILPASVFLAML